MLITEQKKYVTVISNGLRHHQSEDEIIRLLLALGLSQESASAAFNLIKNGIQAGVTSALMNKLPTQELKRGESELFDAAFDEGYKAFKKQMSMTWLRLLIVPVSIVIAVGAIIFLCCKLASHI